MSVLLLTLRVGNSFTLRKNHSVLHHFPVNLPFLCDMFYEISYNYGRSSFSRGRLVHRRFC